jgi:hypothetical protein
MKNILQKIYLWFIVLSLIPPFGLWVGGIGGETPWENLAALVSVILFIVVLRSVWIEKKYEQRILKGLKTILYAYPISYVMLVILLLVVGVGEKHDPWYAFGAALILLATGVFLLGAVLVYGLLYLLAKKRYGKK